MLHAYTGTGPYVDSTACTNATPSSALSANTVPQPKHAVAEYAQGRPFVWIDDEFGFADVDWVAAVHPAPALLHHIDPTIGLAPEDLATVEAWLRRHS